MARTPTPFGKFLRARRVEAGLSLREVADRLGVSHVYLSEVERGVRSSMKSDRWPDLVSAIPGVRLRDLERLGIAERPVQLDLADAPVQYQDLGLALARRIKKQDLDRESMASILQLLEGDDE